jgi:hypothetical protein
MSHIRAYDAKTFGNTVNIRSKRRKTVNGSKNIVGYGMAFYKAFSIAESRADKKSVQMALR